MKRSTVVAGAALACVMLAGAVVAQATKAVHVDSDKATYKETSPGVSVATVWGDLDKGPYGAFTKFAPGTKVPREECTTHHVFFPAGITVIEYLTNLDQIRAARCQ